MCLTHKCIWKLWFLLKMISSKFVCGYFYLTGSNNINRLQDINNPKWSIAMFSRHTMPICQSSRLALNWIEKRYCIDTSTTKVSDCKCEIKKGNYLAYWARQNDVKSSLFKYFGKTCTEVMQNVIIIRSFDHLFINVCLILSANI